MLNRLFSNIKMYICVVLISLLSGCIALPVRTPPANIALGKLVQGEKKQAFNLITNEISAPSVTTIKDLCETHLAYIQILAQTINNDFSPKNANKLALNSHEYIHNKCRAFKDKLSIADSNMVGMYQNLQQPGSALPYALRDYKNGLVNTEFSGYSKSLSEFNLGVVYQDMGQMELSAFHIKNSLNKAKKYFKSSRDYKFSLSESHEFLQYQKFLQKYLDNLAIYKKRIASDYVAEAHKVWENIKSINEVWVSTQTQYVAYIYAIQRFALIDIDFADELLIKAKELAKNYPNLEIANLDINVATASIYTAKGEHAKSAKIFQEWTESFSRIVGRNLQPNDYRLAGLAQESANNHSLSIEYLKTATSGYENFRSNIKVKSRARVLSGLVITPYWGLIRSHVKKYLQTSNKQNLWDALHATRLLKARQFGDILGLEGSAAASNISSELKLGKSTLLLNYVTTDKSIILIAFDQKWQDAWLIPYSQDKFRKQISQIKSVLSNPEKNPKSAYRDLLDISNQILKPVQSRLSKYKKIVIIPDGQLNAIPLNLLSETDEKYQPLFIKHQVSLMPSTSYLLYQNKRERWKGKNTLLAIADPDYSTTKIPKEFLDAYKSEESSFVKRAVTRGGFTQLPETRDEIKKIGQWFKPGNKTLLVGSKATEQQLKGEKLDDYRYIHIATHGVLHNELPGLFEPALVLGSEGVGENGFLTISEVEKLKLNSELTVLSACNTGSGEYYSGEGVMGLSRGFLLAGSRAVIVSLWPVASEETVSIMSRFYDYLNKGKSKAESLRLAQLEMMTRGKVTGNNVVRGLKRKAESIYKSGGNTAKKHPFFWAPFILIGD